MFLKILEPCDFSRGRFRREPVMAMDGHLVLKFLVSAVPSFVFLLIIIFSTLDFIIGLVKLFVKQFFLGKE